MLSCAPARTCRELSPGPNMHAALRAGPPISGRAVRGSPPTPNYCTKKFLLLLPLSLCAPRPAFSALHFKGRKTQALASHLETAWLRTDNAESAPTFCCSRCWRAGTRLALCLGRRARARPSAQKKRTKIQK